MVLILTQTKKRWKRNCGSKCTDVYHTFMSANVYWCDSNEDANDSAIPVFNMNLYKIIINSISMTGN